MRNPFRHHLKPGETLKRLQIAANGSEKPFSTICNALKAEARLVGSNYLEESKVISRIRKAIGE